MQGMVLKGSHTTLLLIPPWSLSLFQLGNTVTVFHVTKAKDLSIYDRLLMTSRLNRFGFFLFRQYLNLMSKNIRCSLIGLIFNVKNKNSWKKRRIKVNFIQN